MYHALALGIAIPVIYFGVQLAAAPFYPGYSFFSHDASSLGSSGSTAPWIFNLGALILAILNVAVAGALVTALPRAGVGRGLAALTALALASACIGSLNAFLHPLPDSRHTGGLLFILGSGFVLLPVVTAAVLWRLGMRRYAAVNLGVGMAVLTIMTSLIQRACISSGSNCVGYQFFLNNYHGLVQRIGAAVALVPIGVIAHLLRSGRDDRVRIRTVVDRGSC
jgi:hypothetical membrane protein